MKSNWIKRFNQLEKYKQEEVLELMCKLESFRDITLNDIVTEIYSLSQDADNIDLFDLGLIELMDKVDSLSNRYNIMTSRYNEKIKLIDDEVTNIITQTNSIIKDMSHTALDFLEGTNSRFMNNVNGNIVRNRLFVFRKRIISTLNDFLNSDFPLESEIDYTRDTINILKRQAMRRVKKESESLMNNIKEKNKKSKIFDYKEMNKLAKLKGYEADHCTGDHLILVHRQSQKSLVVPQKELGKGLSFAIQKQIRTNSV